MVNKELMNKMRMKPNVRVIKLTGGTGDGKSEVTSVFASPIARKIIAKTVGKTNSTLKERLIVYKSELDVIIVAVKMNEQLLEKSVFTEVVVNALAKSVKNFGKIVDSNTEKKREDLEENIKAEINTKVNSRAVFTFLNNEQKEDFVLKLANVLYDSTISDRYYTIYNTVKNNLASTEVKDNSAKFLAAIKNEVENELEALGDNQKKSLWNFCEYVNGLLKDVFYEYFSEDKKSEDGYYYVTVDLENTDEEFVDAMFTSNNLHDGGTLSIEVLCTEIVIYAPIHKAIETKIRNNESQYSIFSDKNGEVAVGIYDTRGLYHINATDDENTDYLHELLYSVSYDALVLVTPLTGDTNEMRLKELYINAFKNYNKQVPVFMLHNKADLFIDSINKEAFSDDPLSMIMTSESDLDINEIRNLIDEKTRVIANELQQVQAKNRKNLKITSLTCYLKRDKSMPKELVLEYNILNSIEKIFMGVTEYLKGSAVKIKYTLHDGKDEIMLELDKGVMSNLIHTSLMDVNTDKKVLNPGMINISENIGKTPHGNGYNAMRRRLRNGDGYSSNIIEEYFYNCKSFSINFTKNLKNFVSDQLVKDIFDQAIEFQGGKFETLSDREKLMKIAMEEIDLREFVSKILYENALLEAEKNAFSFYAKFNNFLKNCIPYFDKGRISIIENDYVSAIEGMVRNAVIKEIDLNISYK